MSGVIVTVDNKHLKDISTIAKSLSKIGMNVENVLRISGVISGSLKPKVQASDLKIKGVKSVELSKKLTAR